jgi:hypothetical protein
LVFSMELAPRILRLFLDISKIFHPFPTPIFCNEVFDVANFMEQNPEK